MTEQEKSLKLAELMGWSIFEGKRFLHTGEELEPYADTRSGLAQFAAILLKFPEAMTSYGMKCDGSVYLCDSPDDCPPTQTNILDEILRMNGVDV